MDAVAALPVTVVVDLERIAGRLGSPVPIDMLAIYEVIDSRIRRVHFVRP
jgi:hypothetical protein